MGNTSQNRQQGAYTTPPFWSKLTYLPPLQPLLLWQSIALCWFCGLLVSTWPISIGMALSILILFDARLRTPSIALLASGAVLAGFFAFSTHLEPRPPYPAWALQTKKNAQNIPQILELEGNITHVQSLSDHRLRIFLQNLHVVNNPHKAFEGKAIWTWDHNIKAHHGTHNGQAIPSIRPLVGQKLRITTKVLTTHSLQNEGISSFALYWQSQGVFWRLWTQGNYGNPQFSGQATALAKAREQALQYFAQALNPIYSQKEWESPKAQGIAFLPALLFGEKYALSQQSFTLMQGASLVHSLALSGQHLALVGLFAVGIGLAFRYIYPHIFLYIPKKTLIGLCSLPLAIIYLWLGNAPPSLLRASIMLFVAVLLQWPFTGQGARIRHLGINILDILFMTLLLITIANPLSIYHIGLQLSALCVASIGLILPCLRRLPKPHAFMIRYEPLRYFIACFMRKIGQIFLISLGIQVFLLPLFLLYFQPSGPWFISNIIWLPILGLWVLPLAALGLIFACLAATFSLPFLLTLSTLCCTYAALPCTYLLQVLAYMQEHDLFTFVSVLRPHAFTLVAWIPLAIALALVPGRIPLKALIQNTKYPLPSYFTPILCTGICIFFIPPLWRYSSHWQNDIQLQMLDVGQGQAIGITTPGGQRILIDGGGSVSTRFDLGKDIVIPSLTYAAAPKVWAVINSHPDTDHSRGLMAVLQRMQVQHFYKNTEPLHTYEEQFLQKILLKKPHLQPKILHKGDIITLPNLWKDTSQKLYLEVLHPPRHERIMGNNNSLVLRLVHKHKSQTQGLALICADIEKNAIQQLLRSGQDIRAAVLILPHHGAKSSLVPRFFDAVAPRLALVSTSLHNRYGFPNTEVQKALNERNIPLYSTANNGALHITWSWEHALKEYALQVKEHIHTQHNATQSSP